MEGRERVVLLDAIIDEGSDSAVEIFDEPFDQFEVRQSGAHHLSVSKLWPC